MAPRAMLLPALLAAACASCAFTQRTDRLYLGTVGGAPVHANRVGTGLVLIPFALVLDVVTFPVQVVVLVLGDDDFLYDRRGPASEPIERVPPATRARLDSMRRSASASSAPPALVAVDTQGELRAIALSAERMDRLVRDVRGER